MSARSWMTIGCYVLLAMPLSAQDHTVVGLDQREPERKLSVARLRLLGLHSDLLPSGGDDADPTEPHEDLAGCEFMFGEFYPFLDLRRPGDPTTMGYTKMFSRYALVVGDTGQVSVSFLALTPAGLESGGLANGPTVVSPSVAWTQDLGDGQALHGFIGQNVQANGRWRHNLDGGILSGFAWQTPVPHCSLEGQEGLFFFLQAQAAYRAEPSNRDASLLYWDVFPGLAWRLNDACFFSVGASRLNFLSCNWQY